MNDVHNLAISKISYVEFYVTHC